MKAILVILIFPLALFLGGCWHARPAAGLQGHTSFELLEPTVGPPPPGSHPHVAQTESDVENISGYFVEKDLAKPVYPADALAAHAGVRFVTVTVTFDENGNATDAFPSLRGFSVADKYADEFLAAVKAAVMRWKITPPHNVCYRREADGQRTYLRTEALATSLDVKFTFEASGQMKSDTSRSERKPSGQRRSRPDPALRHASVPRRAVGTAGGITSRKSAIDSPVVWAKLLKPV